MGFNKHLTIQKAKVVCLTTGAAMAYGIVHDQITVRLCIEYFTIAHPPLFHTTNPTLLAICWGSASTAGIGVIFGGLLALASQSPGLPPVPLIVLCRSVIRVLLVMALGASLAGLLGWELSRHGLIGNSWSDLLPAGEDDRFMAVWFAHAASYLFGFAGSAQLVFRIWNARGRPGIVSVAPTTPWEFLRAGVVIAVCAFIFWWRFH